MKTIKIIDILCYISVGEKDKIPKKVKWRDSTWEYDDRNQDYTNGHLMLFEQLKIIKTKEFLNDEVKILDKEDEFEDLYKPDYQYSICPSWKEKEEVIRIMNENFESHQKAIRDIINNQKKIILRLKDE